LANARILGAILGRRMKNRRKLIVALGACALGIPLRSFAQQPAARMRRIGFLGPNSATAYAKEHSDRRTKARVNDSACGSADSSGD